VPQRDVTDSLLRREFPLPPVAGGDKESRGTVLIVGGASGVIGAPLLAGVAALRAGAGRLQLAIPSEAVVAVSVAVPEAMVVPIERAGEYLKGADAIVIGPGMPPTAETGRSVTQLLNGLSQHCVLDAGALVALEDQPEAPKRDSVTAAITPHAGEMAALMHVQREDVEGEPVRFASEAARRHGVIAALKGPTTYVAHPKGDVYVHAGGCSGLATSGSGDTLTGIICALLARGASPLAATLWGVRLHALAGTALQQRVGVGFLAREICDEIPKQMPP
jgi:ADP-dependent NAD(P)H-hydrate dehydratase